MNGPVTKEKLGLGIGWLEAGIALAGLLVVLGLVVESGPELRQAIIKRTWPARPILGSTLVAVGVFVEVALGVFIARKAKHLESEANERMALAERATAEADARAAEANQKAQEAALALEQLKAPRGLTLDQISKLSEELKQFAGTQYVIGASFSSSELMRLKEHISEALEWAEWIEVDCPSSVDIEAKTTGPGVGITATLMPDEHESYSSMPESNSLIDAGMALAVALSERGIETGSEVVLEPLPLGENPMIYIMIGPKI